MPNQQHIDTQTALAGQERLAIVRGFVADDALMPHEHVIFAIRRGESLHVRSAKGEWLLSYSWNECVPTVHDWITGESREPQIEEIPSLGMQCVNGETCEVRFYKIGDVPIWRTVQKI